MFLRLIFLVLVSIHCLHADDIPSAPLLASIETEPSCIIDGCVNVISGSYFEHEVDLVVPGPEVLKLERLLVNNNTRPCLGEFSKTRMQWQFNDVQLFKVDREVHELRKKVQHFDYRCTYHGKLGESLKFRYYSGIDDPEDKDIGLDYELLKNGLTNNARSVIGAQTNIRNNTMKYKKDSISLNTSNGSTLRFGAFQYGIGTVYFLDEEIQPNYLRRNYTYNHEHELLSCELRNWGNKTLSSLHHYTTLTPTHREVTYKAPDGRSAVYRYSNDIKQPYPYFGMMRGILFDVVRSDKPSVFYTYNFSRTENLSGHWDLDTKAYYIREQVNGKHYPEHRFIRMEYYMRESMKEAREYRTETHYTGKEQPYEVKYEIDNASPEIGRIKSLHAPLGADTTAVQKYRFCYHLPESGGGCTGVYNARNQKTDYSYNDRNRLTGVVKFHASGVPYTTENLKWGPQDTHKEIELLSRTFGAFNSPYKAFSKGYHYDVLGNVICEVLSGNLTGKSETSTLIVDANGYAVPGTADSLVKWHDYSADKFHLLTKTTVGTKTTRNIFIPGTNLLAACLHADAGKTYLRHFYYYDDTGMVIKHLIDDGSSDNAEDLTGVTERKIELIERTDSYPVGYPLVVTELCLDIKTGQEHLLGKKINTYDKSGRLLQEDYYGNDELFAFSKSWEYDAHGNITKEVRADGAVITRGYDLNDNMILETGPNPLLTKELIYDYMNRLIEVKEHHPDMLLTKHFRYDVCGNLIAKVDAMGTETRTHYDDFNRPIIVEGAPIPDENGTLYRPVTRYEYNELSQPTKITAPDGSITEFAYTLYGKPCKIAYPDGSIERFEFDVEGKLLKEVAKNGTTILYSYDAQNRIIETIHLTSSGEEAYRLSSVYNTFHLLEKTDPDGHVTYFDYDCYGRLISERKGESITSYAFDSLNRTCKTTISSLSDPETGSAKCVILNSLGQILEERVENLKGEVLTCSRYAYDVEGNKVRIERDSEAGLAVATQVIDTHGVPLKLVDPEGNVTSTRLYLDYFNLNGQRVVKTETTDPLGLTTVIIKDVQGRTAEQSRLNAYGEEIQKTSYIYNIAGKCIRTIEKVYRGEESAPDVINAWEYNSTNQLVSMTEALGQPEEKRTYYTYNFLGQLETTTKPDGVSLQFYYDGLGRLLEEKSDDHSIHHRYTYDICSNPIQVDNLVNHTTTTRQYDEHNRVTQEKLANGLELKVAYNPDGGLKKVTLPDNSSINYAYDGPLLTSVDRRTSKGFIQYHQTYNAYDLSGNLLQGSLINDLGEWTSEYTLKGYPKEQKNSYYSESLTYDAMNNITSKRYQDNLGRESNQYAYDALRQMTEESGQFNHQYTNDSLYNRTSKDGNKYTLNSLNSILSDGESHYTYDACGNVTSYTKNNKAYSFTYDALDRLTTLKIDDTTYVYTYDDQNRCITRQVTSDETLSEKILFVGQCDIGTTDQNGKIKHLRVIGKGKGAEIGSAIALELNDEVFAPLHDHQGNLIALIDSTGKTRESYRYSAFGEEAIFDSSGSPILASEVNNPWRFSSKRKEADFNLFGRRFYNPDLGRWLTPDPAGHEAGPNLYAYVSNSPLSHIDLFGFLEEEEKGGFSFASLRDSLHDGWSACRDFISRGFESLREGYSSLGAGISRIAHEVPFPEVKEVMRVVGHVMEHGTIRGFEFSYNLNRSGYYSLDRPSHPSGKVSLVVMNGMDSTLNETKGVAIEESTRFDDCNVHIGYNGSEGAPIDFIECSVHKLGIETGAVDAAVEAIRKGIHDVGGVGNGGIVKIQIHSQGGMIFDLALKYFTDEEKAMFYVRTYGSAKLIDPAGFESCINYVSEHEWVSWIVDHSAYRAAKMGLRPDVIFLEPLETGMGEHAIRCKTYEAARKMDADFFKKKYLH